jgi:hypothetical protein
MSSTTDRPFGLLSRRGVIKTALASGSAVALGAGGLAALRGRAPAVKGLRALSPHAYRTMRHLAAAAFPELNVPEPRVDLARAFDGYLADEPLLAQKEAGQALLLLEYGPVVFQGSLRTFSHLDPEAALKHFVAWGTSDSLLRRQVAGGLRRFLCLLFYDDAAVWSSLGYDGPLVREGAP